MIRPLGALALALSFAVPALAAPAPPVGKPAAAPAANPPTTTPSATSPAPGEAPADSRLPLDDLRHFVEAFERIRGAYVEPVDDQALFAAAIRGMLSSLDPHSAYLDAKDFEELQVTTSGEFGGVGIEISLEDGVLRVVTPMDDTPAAKAGLQPGDLIIKIDDKAVKGMSNEEAVNALRGKPGSKVRLLVLRQGQEPKDVILVRAKIEVPSVRTRWLEDGYGYVRISQFQVHTGRDLGRELDKLKTPLDAKTKAPKALRGLVLDLRNNPGGVLGGAVEVADAFLDSGLVVYTKGRVAEAASRFQAQPGQLLPTVPLIVLINGGSASASEIVAGALQDHHRAVIVGTTSFGKGSVQTVLPLGEDRAIKLTTARYYTPSGRSIQAEGIKPDIEVEPAQVTALAGSRALLREADLKGHLGNEASRAVEPITPPAPGKTDDERPLVERDYQLYQALLLLKGMNVLGQASAVQEQAPGAPPPQP